MPVHPREVEDVAHEAVEALGLLARSWPRPPRTSIVPSRERLRVAEHRRQRRLQLVADREEERALGVARMLELLGHVVERLGERRELGRALGRHGGGCFAGREPAARLGDAAQRPRDPAREQQRDGRGERHADRRRDEQSLEVRTPGRGADHARAAAARAPCPPPGARRRTSPCRRPRSCRRSASRFEAGRPRRAVEVGRRPVERRDDGALVLAPRETGAAIRDARAAAAPRARACASRSACCETSWRIERSSARRVSAAPTTSEIAAASRTTNSDRSQKLHAKAARERRSCARHLVADAAHGPDELGPAELSPERRHVHVDGARPARETRAPRRRSSKRSRVSTTSGCASSDREQVELLARQLDRHAGDGRLVRVAAHDDVAERRAPVSSGHASVRRRTACTRASSSRGEKGFVT